MFVADKNMFTDSIICYRYRKDLVFTSYFVFQAQLIDLRSDLHEVRATKSVMEKEVNTLVLQLHASQLQLHQAKSGQEGDSEAIKRKLVSIFVKIF